MSRVIRQKPERMGLKYEEDVMTDKIGLTIILVFIVSCFFVKIRDGLFGWLEFIASVTFLLSCIFILYKVIQYIWV